MQTSTGTTGYHASFGFRPVGKFCDPAIRVRGYTEPQLNHQQHAAVILSASTITAWLRRPIEKLHAFYFLCDVPGESSRIYASDKRAHFFRTLFGIKWLAGPSNLWTIASYAFQLTAFTKLRDLIPCESNTTCGFTAGCLTGLLYAFLRHPYEVLLATAEAEKGPMKFVGAWDVFMKAVTEKPNVLLGIYRGVSVAACSQVALLGTTWGVYNAVRYDGVYHGTPVLFLYCHGGALLGKILQYPFLSIRQQVRIRNQHTRGRPHTFRSYIVEVRRKHGITKIYDGFFASRPILNSIPAALLLVTYDLCSRHLTEQLHPELRKMHGEVNQPLYSRHAGPYAETLPTYEFKRG